MSPHKRGDGRSHMQKLSTFPKPSSNSCEPIGLRRSPRKRTTDARSKSQSYDSVCDSLSASSSQIRNAATQRSPLKNRKDQVNPTSTAQRNMLLKVPLLSKQPPTSSSKTGAVSSSSPQRRSRSVRLAHVDSLLLPLSSLAIQEPIISPYDHSVKSVSKSRAQNASKRPNTKSRKLQGDAKASKGTAGRFLLTEAECGEGESLGEEEEDEDTDLSGFIVDDDAELSYHDSSESDDTRTRRKVPTKSTRRLQRGSPDGRQSQDNSDDTKTRYLENSLSRTMMDLHIEDKDNQTNIEVIDLTTSPTGPLKKTSETTLEDPFTRRDKSITGRHLFDDFGKSLRLSPPKPNGSSINLSKAVTADFDSSSELPNTSKDYNSVMYSTEDRSFTTPPVTPPVSPSKLKSPSKFLSPSKRDNVDRPAHRQSTDAFWDLNEVNDWNDQYSPRKDLSPRKGLARFQIWSDDSEEDVESNSSDSLPSPCASPSKLYSPSKSPMKAEMRRLADERKAFQVRKKAFESVRVKLAKELFDSLDRNITHLRISELASSTGGVQIIWSKTLRSTAGRANWKRTVTKPTGSPVKGNSEPFGAVVKHFANIELAEKVIDSEDRLINTLAHEFCHLANFMISNIRDQPHGASFKKWATQVTNLMKKSEKESWRKCQVTTKHAYNIDWKYLWVCKGREFNTAMEYLGIEDEGCGAEYGRHSKSIDVAKQRCGRCKGMLRQVRPKPRSSPTKKQLVSKPMKRVESSGSEKGREVIELSD